MRLLYDYQAFVWSKYAGIPRYFSQLIQAYDDDDYDIERIVNYAKSRNCSTNYDDLANAVGELYRNIDYVIFTKIYILQSSDYVDRHQIAIVVDVFDRGSEDVVRSASAKTLSGHSYIRSACAQLLTTLLGEDTKRY